MTMNSRTPQEQAEYAAKATALAAQVVVLLNELNAMGATAVGLAEIITPGGSIIRRPWGDGQWLLQPLR